MYIRSDELGDPGVRSTLQDVDIVDTRGASRLLGLSESWLTKKRLFDEAESPRYIRSGRLVFYRIGDLRAWQDARTAGG